MNALHHLHRLRIQHGKTTLIFIRDTLIIIAGMYMASDLGGYIARYLPF